MTKIDTLIYWVRVRPLEGGEWRNDQNQYLRHDRVRDRAADLLQLLNTLTGKEWQAEICDRRGDLLDEARERRLQ